MNKKTHFPILVTGCPRSGTLYTALWLRYNRYDVHHEGYAPDGIVSWMAAVEAPKVPFGTTEGRIGKTFDHKFGLIRHPLDAIGSGIHIALGPLSRTKFKAYIEQFVPMPKEEISDLEYYLRYYLRWMHYVKTMVDYWVRLEDGLGDLLGYLTKHVPQRPSHYEGALPKKTTHHYGSYKKVTFKRLAKETKTPTLVDELAFLMESFGYEKR